MWCAQYSDGNEKKKGLIKRIVIRTAMREDLSTCKYRYIRGEYDKFPDFFFRERVNDLRHSLFHLNCLITTASELRE